MARKRRLLPELADAVAALGNQTKVADIVGVTPQAVSEMLRKGKKVPAEWCLPIERATRGKISRTHLRPDLYPPEVAA